MVLNVLISLLFAIVGGGDANRRRALTVTFAVGTAAAGSFAVYNSATGGCAGGTQPPTEPGPPPAPTATPPTPPAPPPTAPVDAGPPPPDDASVTPPEPPTKPSCKFKLPSIARAANLPSESKIVGGTDALPGEFPFATSLQTLAGSHFCGGSVFRDNWILTAAHCVEVYGQFLAVVGRHDLRTVEGNEYRVKAADVRVHPLYGTNPDAPLDYDVALVKLPEKASVDGVPLHVGNLGDDWAWAIGWGRKSSGGPLTDTLKKVRMPIVAQDTCKGFYQEELTNRMICSDRWGEGSCQGDSGGALLFASGMSTEPDGTVLYFGWQLAGTVSWGIDCAAGFPGVYTRLTSPKLGPQVVLAEWVDVCAEAA